MVLRKRGAAVIGYDIVRFKRRLDQSVLPRQNRLMIYYQDSNWLDCLIFAIAADRRLSYSESAA